MTHLSLGIDQSTTDTGLCLIRFENSYKFEPVKTATVKTPDYPAMIEAVCSFMGLEGPDVCCAEWGYISVDKGTKQMDKGVQGFYAVQTCTWVECLMHHYFKPTMFCKASAHDWRERIWGHGKGWMPRKQAKAYSITYAEAAGIESPTHDMADAFGLALYGKEIYEEATNV